ncbi:SHOCT domain-containing protein [Sphingobacterium sp. T2]
MTRKLKKLKSLYDKQLITQAEYESKKAELLSKL